MGKYRKLDADDWGLIRQRYMAGESPRSLALEFGVAESTLFRRRSLERWPRQAGLDASIAATPLRLCQPSRETDPADAGDRGLGDEVDSCDSVAAQTPASPAALAVSADHAATARRLRRRINQLLAGDSLGATADRQPQAVKDLSMALERLQKIERLALGLDTATPDRQPGVVIIIPAKLSPEDWEERMTGQASYGTTFRIAGS